MNPEIITRPDGKIEITLGNRAILLRGDHRIYAEADISTAYNFDRYFDLVPSISEGDHQIVDFSQRCTHFYKPLGVEFDFPSVAEFFGDLNHYTYRYSIQPTDLVFDVGAYAGVTTYLFAQKARQVIAFEPDYNTRQSLFINIFNHNLKNVLVSEKGLSRAESLVPFNQEGAQGSAIPYCIGRETVSATDHIRTITLAQACQQYGVPQFIKMNIEGAEVDVLESSIDFLHAHPIHFAVASDHVVRGEPTKFKVEAALKAAGYEVESSQQFGGWMTWASLDIFADYYNPR